MRLLPGKPTCACTLVDLSFGRRALSSIMVATGNTSAAESPKESEKIVSDAELQAATTKAKATDDATTKAEATEEATMKAKTPDESRTKAKATDKDSKEEAKTNFSKKADPKKKKDQDKDDEDEEQDEEKNQRAMVGGVLLVLGMRCPRASQSCFLSGPRNEL